MELEKLTELVGDGKIFSVEFIMRGNGLRRTMIARTGVTAGLKPGAQAPYEPSQHGLLPVYDLQKKGYRVVPADNVLRLKEHGREHVFDLASRARAG